jgi:hypothetical protein
MNWDAIGAIAESLGAIGVIASLVYLATQIRHSREQMDQNTRALRAAAYQQIHEHQGHTFTTLPHPDMDVARRGLEDFHQLSVEDAWRFNLWALHNVMNLESAHYQYRKGMLEESRWRVYSSNLRSFFRAPGVVAWWNTEPQRPDLSPEFIALVEEILDEGPDHASPAQ